MHNGKKISVAMASYNGEKYIEKQIESICNQTIMPDEIIVSDDGSRDNTLSLVKNLAEKYRKYHIEIRVLMDNPRHGYCGNFEWAITHTTGDYIFISDQDDLWYPNKIETVLNIFELHSNAECVFHEAQLIDGNDQMISGIFNYWTHANLNDIDCRDGYLIDRDKFLLDCITLTISPGMADCITKEALKTILPFPKCDDFHDRWIEFCAVLNNKCWYTSQVLEGYRLHGDNTVGNKVYKGTKMQLFKKKMKRFSIKGVRNSLTMPALSQAMMKLLESEGFLNSEAYKTVERLNEIGIKELTAVTSGQINGAFQLYRLYKTDVRYRMTGKMDFLYKLYLTIIFSQKKRISAFLPEELQVLNAKSREY